MAAIPDSPKVKLRSKMRKLLKKIDDLSLKEKSENIVNNLAALLNEEITKNHLSCSKSLCVGVFAPIVGEPNCLALDKDEHFELAFPSLEDDQMVFRKAKFEELSKSLEFGVSIYTPSQDALKIVPDVIIIPGLAFDSTGNRLGRGKGFYDRFLEKFQGVKIGLCFNEQIMSTVPCEKHDVVMDYVVTDLKRFSMKSTSV